MHACTFELPLFFHSIKKERSLECGNINSKNIDRTDKVQNERGKLRKSKNVELMTNDEAHDFTVTPTRFFRRETKKKLKSFFYGSCVRLVYRWTHIDQLSTDVSVDSWPKDRLQP